MTDVLILFASKSDEDSYNQIFKLLDKARVSYEFKLASAHKTPEEVDKIVTGNDYKVVISGAGLAAALPGVIAAKTIKPVIGVPCKGNYQGLDALLSIVQMPPGIPVLSVGAMKADIAAQAAVKILKNPEKIVLIGDKNSKAYKKAEDILKQFEIVHSHSEQLIDNAINIIFTQFDEPIEKKGQLVIYCPISLDKDDKAEASLNLLKHSEHGLWVGLNNGVNAAVAAIEILAISNDYEQKLLGYRKEIGDKVRKENK